MHHCKKCDKDKNKAEMSLWGGGVSEVCLACREAMKRPRKADVSQAKPSSPAAASEDTDLAIECLAGLGFSAALDGEQLVVVQGTDNLTLAKHEARQLFEKFAEWAIS
jgi:hypothetical protein